MTRGVYAASQLPPLEAIESDHALHLIGDRFVSTPSRLIFTFSFRARLRAFLSVAKPLSSEDKALYSLPPAWIPGLIFNSYGHWIVSQSGGSR